MAAPLLTSHDPEKQKERESVFIINLPDLESPGRLAWHVLGVSVRCF